MKRNSFSSFKLIAILLSMLMFTACDKNEFTAQDALDLELQRLTREREIEAEREAFQTSQAAAAHAYRKVLDSLERVNAGGLVYYSVAVVPGGGSVFTGGRTEGVSGATVTISQFGQNVAVTTDESGIASFPDLRSGEVTVNVSIDGFTDLTYISNLTPDGGVANNASVYVGNVVPVFENDESNPDNLNKMAVLHGRGFAELDITYGNDTEEIVPSGTGISAFIDPNASFWAKYLNEQNDEGSDAFPGNTGSTNRKSGHIQRIVYEEAGKATTYDANGDYSMMIPATGSGLSTKMKYSEFITDRTYFDDDNGDFGLGTGTNDSDFGVVSKRFIYGPDVTPTPINLTGILQGNGVPLPFFDFVTQEGSAAVSISNAGSVTSVTVDGTDDGLYLVPPTVTLSAPPAGGTQATAVAVLETNPINTNSRLREIASFKITAEGAGYTTAPTVTITRQESGITGTVRQEAADGGLSSTVRVVDGGYGFTEGTFDIITGSFHATPGSSFTKVGDWTGIDPLLNTPNGFTGTAPVLNFTYDFMANTPGNGSSNFDVVTRIDIPTTPIGANGKDWTAADLTAVNGTPFKYVQNSASFPSADLEGDPLFITSGGALVFNPDYGTAPNNAGPGGLNLINSGALNLEIPALSVPNLVRGTSYVFVPQINLVLGNATGSGASMTCAVNELGVLTKITLVGGTGFTDAMASQIQVQVANPSNALDAEFFLGGSGIQAYNITNAAGNTGYVTEVLDVATSINTNPQTNLAKNAVAADEAANGNTFVALAGTPTDGTAAYGYPVWDFSRKVVTGVELFDAGNNYDGLAAGNATLNWELVPVYGIHTNWDASAETKITAEQLVVTLTNGGSGYATAPVLAISGGGLHVGAQLPTNGDANPQADDFTFWINNQGTIVDIKNNYNTRVGDEFPYTVASVAADPLTAALSSEHEFDLTLAYVGRMAPFTATPSITPVFDADVFVRWQGDTETEFEDMIDEVPTIVDYADGLGNAVDHYAFAVAPTIQVIDFRGIGSGAAAVARIDNATGKITNLDVTAGGSGWIFTLPTNSEYISAEGFRVLGGSDGNNGAFDVYSGIQYLRDVHYGTGLELE